MGNQQLFPSATPSQGFSTASFDKDYTYEKEVNDSRFGLIKIYRNKAKPDIFAMVLTKSSLDGNFDTFSRELAVRSQLSHANMCKLLGHSQDNMQKLCGASSTLTIYSEYEKNNLEKELQKKSSGKVFFFSFKKLIFLLGISLRA